MKGFPNQKGRTCKQLHTAIMRHAYSLVVCVLFIVNVQVRSQCVGEWDGVSYDFNSLTLTSGSYQIYQPPYEYHVNICGSLHMASPCDQGSCQTRRCWVPFSTGQENKTVQAIGLGQFQLDYLNGSPNCGGISRSAIFLECNALASSARITRVEEVSPCVYHYWMDTNLACPIDVPVCATYAPDGRLHYFGDLTVEEAYGPQYSFVNGSQTVDFNICATVTETECDNSTAVCQRPGRSLGHVSEEVSWVSPGNFQLRYLDGDASFLCPNTSSTVVHFQCQRNASPGRVIRFEEAGPCEYHLTVATEIACPAEPPSCGVFLNGELLDLTPLSIASGELVVPTPEYDYYFSVCNTTISDT